MKALSVFVVFGRMDLDMFCCVDMSNHSDNPGLIGEKSVENKDKLNSLTTATATTTTTTTATYILHGAEPF